MEKFEFPERGFYLVADKIDEADFFIGKMKSCPPYEIEFRHYLSAFVSAARSVTFTMQFVMAKYPGFDAWYPARRERLAANKLARFFVTLRNESEKRGVIWTEESGCIHEEGVSFSRTFTSGPGSDLSEFPNVEVVEACEQYLRIILSVVSECYRDFADYVDPRRLFTIDGLAALRWTIEDLEECLGFPRGYTNIPWNSDDKDEQRLRALEGSAGFDELFEEVFVKYGISFE